MFFTPNTNNNGYRQNHLIDLDVQGEKSMVSMKLKFSSSSFVITNQYADEKRTHTHVHIDSPHD